MNFRDIKITVIGLGYVGLPLAVEFAKKYTVFGFDINQKRIDDLRKGIDSTLEVENKDLLTVLANTDSNGLFPTTDIDDISSSNHFDLLVSEATKNKFILCLKKIFFFITFYLKLLYL